MSSPDLIIPFVQCIGVAGSQGREAGTGFWRQDSLEFGGEKAQDRNSCTQA
jgi:hypothetical protein